MEAGEGDTWEAGEGNTWEAGEGDTWRQESHVVPGGAAEVALALVLAVAVGRGALLLELQACAIQHQPKGTHSLRAISSELPSKRLLSVMGHRVVMRLNIFLYFIDLLSSSLFLTEASNPAQMIVNRRPRVISHNLKTGYDMLPHSNTLPTPR